MEKGLGFVAIILIWGGAIYLWGGSLLFGGHSSFLNGDNFLASSLASFEQAINTKSGIFGFFGESGFYSESDLHLGKSADIRDIDVSSKNNSLVFASSDKGLLATNDGGLNWQVFSDVEHRINSGADVYQASFLSDGTGYVSVYKNGKGIFYSSPDNFLTAEKLFEIDGEKITAFALSGDSAYLGLSGGKIFLYSISQNASRYISFLPSSITSLQAGRNDSGLLYASTDSGGFWVSRDSGVSFKRMKYLDKYGGANEISQFFVSPLNDNLIFAATNYGLIKSADGGASWKVFKDLPSEDSEIRSVYYDSSSSEIYASSNGKLYINKEGSLNWKILDTGSDRNISRIFPYNGKILIGTEN
jgi:photosystem II stability/assembly factor-like uncharacterized protein